MGDLDADKLFDPSMSGWTSLAYHRAFRRRYQKPDEPEFVQKFNQIIAVRDSLMKIHKSLGQWSANMKKLYLSAKQLGTDLQTNSEIFKEAAWAGDILLKDESAMANVRTKIGMINDLIAQRKRLRFMKLRGGYAEYKLEQLRKKQASGDESLEQLTQRYLTIKKESERQRQEVMQQVLLVVNKFVEQAEQNGVSDLIKPQLQAFKLSQFHMFLNCQKLVQGREEDQGLKELENHWTAFTSNIADAIPANQAGGSFDGSAMFLRDKLEAQGALPVNNNGKQHDHETDLEDEEVMQEAEPKMTNRPKENVSKAPVKAVGGYVDDDFDGENLDDVEVKTRKEMESEYDEDERRAESL